MVAEKMYMKLHHPTFRGENIFILREQGWHQTLISHYYIHILWIACKHKQNTGGI